MKKKNKNINKKVNININNILDKLSRKKKMIIMFIMIIISILGGTFAWFSYQSKKSALVLTIGDLNDSQVIITPYEIRDTMLPVFNYSDGVYSQITVINSNDSKMNMELYYKINELPLELVNSGLKYTIVNSDSKDGTYTEVLTDDFSNYNDGDLEIYLFNTTINSNTTTYYRLYLWLDSSVGNQSVLQDTNLDVELNANISRSANAPILDYGMIPVIISNDGIVTTIMEDDNNWYDYNSKNWANAILVTESSRSNYLNTTGVEVTSSDILGYYVWIPRFKYKIWTTSVSSTGKEQEIGIIFESALSAKSSGTKVGEYLTHPAFTFGNEELSGFWVGKFETTGTGDNPTVLPNTTSLRNQNISTQFTTALKFAGGTLSDGNVSFSGSSTYGLSKNTDSHMMKNSEWGAVAYLSHSRYGINEEIYINNSSGYYTGRSGGAVGGSVSAVTYGSYSWLGQQVSTDNVLGEITDATLGTKASTTGNVTGIYDMSGGAWDRIMGNYNNTAGSSGFTTFPPSKYYDVYSITENSNCTIDICGGHALYETAGWYSDYSGFIGLSYPWFYRGGDYGDGINAGMFNLSYYIGSADESYSWRSVLVPRYVSDVEFNPNGGMTTISYTEPGEYIYTVTGNGSYQLEVWGAQGGTGMVDGTSKNIGGYGAYSVGTISLNANTNLYINVGGKGENAKDRQAGGSGGYNGGGTGGTDSNYTSSGGNEPGAGGGGATHIATKSGLLSTLSSNTDALLIAAGGGGGGSYFAKGGSGGGIEGNKGVNTGASTSASVAGGTQTSGFKFGLGGTASNSFNSGGGGGGAGYYGGKGGTGATGVSGAGGSGYIGNSLLTNKYMYCYNCTTSDEESTKTYTTTIVSSTPTANYAKSGDGAVRISTSAITIKSFSSIYYDVPNVTRDGYIFKGWNTKEDGSGIYITNDSQLISYSNHTLYAIWEEANITIPTFTYTGTYQIVDDDDNEIVDTSTYTGNWKIRFLDDGVLTITDLKGAANGVDIFLVGGGGKGGAGGNYYSQSSRGGAGGGGGAAITVTNFPIAVNTSYTLDIGTASSNTVFKKETTTYYTALHGENASQAYYSNSSWNVPKASGGAGRLSSETSNYGAENVIALSGAGSGGTGNYEFFGTSGKRYGAGGGAGTAGVSTGVGGVASSGNYGGADGGGRGGTGCSQTLSGRTDATSGSNGTKNTGSGGGGGGGTCGSGTTSVGSPGSGGTGGSGIIIIRNHR